MAVRAAVRQRGWVGPLMLLLALLVVMVLAAGVLKQYMLPPGAARPSQTLPRDAGTAPAEGEAPAPVQALERARGLQDTVRRQAEEMQRRIDSADR